jgi:prepilin-type N-terminal cleavage/methylation domain-containing protein
MKMNRINRKSGFTLIELLVAIVFAIVTIGIFVGAVRNVAGTSDGKRVGVLTKFSSKGLFIKSYEGELNMGGIRNKVNSDGNRSAVANVWEFSCSNPLMAEKLENLVGKEVVIKYHQSFAGLMRDTSYDVVSVEEVNNK